MNGSGNKLNIFDYLDDALNRSVESIKNTLEDTFDDLKELINSRSDNKLQFEKSEMILQEYFNSTEGIKTYKYFEEFYKEKLDCFLIKEDYSGKQYITVYGGKTFFNLTSSLDNNLKELNQPIIFRINNGKVAIDENLTKEYINSNQGNIYEFKELEKLIKTNQYHSEFWKDTYGKIYSEFMKYAKSTYSEKGSLYMVHEYGQNGILSVYEYKNYGKGYYGMDLPITHEVSISELPEGTLQNTMLRKVNGKFVIDEEANKIVSDKLVEWATERIDKLETTAKENRIENEIYLVKEKYRNSLYLVNNNTKDEFYEKKIPEDIIKNIGTSTILRYTNGEYAIDEELTNLNLNGELNFFNKEKDEVINNDRNQISLIEKTEKDRNVTTGTRGKMHSIRSEILENYASENLDKGSMYYIYGTSDFNENTYLLTLCSEAGEIEVDDRGCTIIGENELPLEAGVDSVLRVRNGKLTLDKEATAFVEKEMQAKIEELLKEQEKESISKRIEGHFYKVCEVHTDKVVLIDMNSPANLEGTAYSCFQEFEFSKELLRKSVEGDIVRYVNGEYVPYVR